MQEPSHTGPWYIARSGESQGPYTWPQLQSAARQGLVRPRDWVWQQGMRAWIRAESQDGLLPAIREVTPPPPEYEAPASIEAKGPAPAPPPAWVPTPAPSRPVSLGETTRHFLAAAGVSAKVRQRRQRQAGLLLAGGIGLVVATGLFFRGAAEGENPPSAAPTASATDDRLDDDAAQLRRSEACRLTGDCRRRRRRAPRAAPSAEQRRPEAHGPNIGRRGDSEPETISIGGLQTSGVKETLIAEAHPVELEVRKETEKEGLSATETALVKRRVTPSLKRCRGVFAASKVIVRFATSGRGRVRQVDVRSGPRHVRRCLKRSAGGWRFGREFGARTVELTVPARKGVVRISVIE